MTQFLDFDFYPGLYEGVEKWSLSKFTNVQNVMVELFLESEKRGRQKHANPEIGPIMIILYNPNHS